MAKNSENLSNLALCKELNHASSMNNYARIKRKTVS